MAAVRPLANGRWQVDIYDRRGQRIRRNFRTKREADAWRIETEGQMRTGSFRAEALKMTVQQLADEWLRYCASRQERKERMTRATVEFYAMYVRNHICNTNPTYPFKEGIGHLRLTEVTNRTIVQFRDRVRSHGTSVPSTRAILRTAHAMFEFGRQHDLIGFNPVEGVRVHGRRDEGARKVTPPPKEVVNAVLHSSPPRLGMPAMVAAATGVRIGELRALRYRHLDCERRLLRVETRVDVYGEEDGQGTKSAAGVRSVPVSAQLVEAIQEWRSQSRFKEDEDLLFPNLRGGFLKYETLADQLANFFIDRPNLTKFTWHQLRHFAISCWIEAGLSPKTVQTFAGHASLQTTMDRYGHLFPSDSHWEAMDRIAEALQDHARRG